MFKAQPALESERLVLRPFTLADSSRVMALAGDAKIAAMTLNIPHPYLEGMAEQWISGHKPGFDRGESVTFAITIRASAILIGAVGLVIDKAHRKAELGYWLGLDYWNQGFCTEAARLIVEFGFSSLNIHKISSRHLVNNPASGKVMRKLGMTKEGSLIDEVFKGGEFHSLELYGLLNTQLS